jgi:hypothetical protein
MYPGRVHQTKNQIYTTPPGILPSNNSSWDTSFKHLLLGHFLQTTPPGTLPSNNSSWGTSFKQLLLGHFLQTTPPGTLLSKGLLILKIVIY